LQEFQENSCSNKIIAGAVGFEPTTTSLGGSLTSTLINIDQRDLIINWSEFLKWLNSKYSKSYVKVLRYYCKKYYALIANDKIRELDLLPDSIRNNVVKSLIALSKYLGIHEQLKNKLKPYGIKTSKHDAIKSFLRILKSSNSNILKWCREAINNVRPHEKTFYGLHRKKDSQTMLNISYIVSRVTIHS